MIDPAREHSGRGAVRTGSQPIALAAGALFVVLAAITAITIWRSYSGASPELDRTVAARQLQARATTASEQLVEKTNGLQLTQQESIDQLQMVQDQLQQMRNQLAAQQADTKHLTEQMSTLTGAIDGLRQSFASVQPAEPPSPAPSHHRALRSRAHAARVSHGAGTSG